MALAACERAPVVRYAEPPPEARIERVFVAAMRHWLPPGAPRETGLGAPRPEVLSFGHVDVSIPPTHRPGAIEWPEGRDADPTRHFVVAGQRTYDGPRAFDAVLRRSPGGAGGARIVYVHGFNVELPEAVFRVAQMRADFEPRQPAVAFVWPSAGDPRGYLYDRDSAVFARDDLERLLRTLTDEPGERVFLIAHSMGSFLAMETLRQIALKGDRRVLDRLSGVVLMSPDLDPEVFRRQAKAIGRLPKPFYIFVAQRDRILSLSALLRGRKAQLGQITDPRQVEDLDVTVIDVTDLSDDEASSHFIPVSSPQAISVIRGMFDQLTDPGSAFGRFVRLEPAPTMGPLRR